MNTVVIQSFRSSDVPRYIVECCNSVRSWAQMAGYSYRFFDDTFLDLVPDWYRRKAGPHICVVTDLARLIQAQHLLMNGFDRVVWCDADMLVFRPESLALQVSWTCAYCKEVWVFKDEFGRLSALQKVNNSMCVFTKAGLGHLAEYIDQCYAIVQASPNIASDLSVGTELLTAVHSSKALISSVGIVSPHLMEAVLENDEQTLSQYLALQGTPIYSANLCNAIRRSFGNCPKLFDYLCAGVVEKLRSGRPGELLSQS